MIWTPVLIAVIHFHYRYLPFIKIITLSWRSPRQLSGVLVYCRLYGDAGDTAAADLRPRPADGLPRPGTHMPNLRALSRALNGNWSTLCLRIPELELLGRHYGVLLRIQYKQMLANHRALLEPNEAVYHLAGHDLVFRLNSEGHQARIHLIERSLRQFRFHWDGSPAAADRHELLQRRSPVKHLYLLLGELNTIADMSLASGHPENLQRRGAGHIQQDLKDKVVMMNRILKALEQDHFVLMAQPIRGIRGDNYHEVLLRMKGESGELTGPNEFLPVAHEFGLSSRVDQWVMSIRWLYGCQPAGAARSAAGDQSLSGLVEPQPVSSGGRKPAAGIQH
jgi:hypothetical protein